MNFRELVRRYQFYNPATGTFDANRNSQDYAAILGVHPSQLSRFYAGQTRDSSAILRGFLQAFPHIATEVGPALLAEVA